MKKSVKQDIAKLNKHFGWNYSINEFKVFMKGLTSNNYLVVFMQESYSRNGTKQLSEDFIEEFSEDINWYDVSKYQKLSDKFILKFSDKVVWYYIVKFQKLSESLIEHLIDCGHISLGDVIRYQNVSEDFLRKNFDKIDFNIGTYRAISENFMREFADELNWDSISSYQKLSESFIEEFASRVDWRVIVKYQKLSESFIEKNLYPYCLDCLDLILKYQKFSEDFIRRLIDVKVLFLFRYNYTIGRYQKLSEEFRKEINIEIPENNWLYTSKEDKLKYIKENTSYEVIDDEYIIAYKSVRSDRYSCFNFQYQYLDGETYESHCDCNIDDDNSFGLSAWTINNAIGYYSEGKILKVKIAIDKIGAIVKNNEKIRCFELTVIGEVDDHGNLCPKE